MSHCFGTGGLMTDCVCFKDQNFGICKVLLILSVPDKANNKAKGCNAHGPTIHVPHQIVAPIISREASQARMAVSSTQGGMGGIGRASRGERGKQVGCNTGV